MGKPTHHELILGILSANGEAGMNSYRWRMRFIQLPARIKELRNEGFDIESRNNPDRSVTYILRGSP